MIHDIWLKWHDDISAHVFNVFFSFPFSVRPPTSTCPTVHTKQRGYREFRCHYFIGWDIPRSIHFFLSNKLLENWRYQKIRMSGNNISYFHNTNTYPDLDWYLLDMPKRKKTATDNVLRLLLLRDCARVPQLITTGRLSRSHIGHEGMRAMKLVASWTPAIL